MKAGHLRIVHNDHGQHEADFHAEIRSLLALICRVARTMFSTVSDIPVTSRAHSHSIFIVTMRCVASSYFLCSESPAVVSLPAWR